LDYKEQKMKNYKEMLLETSLARVHQHTKDSNIGMITAHRGENTPEQNKAGNKELEKSIRDAGHGFAKVKGRYIENFGTPQAKAVDEHSYLVIGKRGDDSGELKNFLLQHGEKHGQDSILHKAHNEPTAKLHGTKEGGWPGKGEVADVGKWHPNRAGEFHSVLGGKKTFSFESFQLESVSCKVINAGDDKAPTHKEPLVTVDGKKYTTKELAAMKSKKNEEIEESTQSADWKAKYKLKEGVLDFLKPKTQAQKNLPINRSSSIVNDVRQDSEKVPNGNIDVKYDDKMTPEEESNVKSQQERSANAKKTYAQPNSAKDLLNRVTNPRKYAEPDNISNAQDPSKRKGI
jgi:hypothetical protein